MKLSLTLLAFVSSAAAFSTPATFSRGLTASVASTSAPTTTTLYSDPDEEEEGLDLNLEEMFDM